MSIDIIDALAALIILLVVVGLDIGIYMLITDLKGETMENVKGTVWIKLEDAKAAVDAVSFDIDVTGPETSESFVQEVAQVVCDACRKDIKERLDKIEDSIVAGFDIVNGEVMITDAEVVRAYEDEA